MTRIPAALALACALLISTAADARPRRRGPCVPVFIDGAGTIWICGARSCAR
ncbi:hypothetical protein QO001_000847 [Methylobacterium brachiatum]|jgi:hypothetical protein|uniref:Porin n=1 Tax=Methylobacterium brachiatum TaxID=269660 RepID=A0AAJ1TND6_9HYPH|nr:hypothetical protein [Methylobacterium brachiatum]MCB4803502.1 hypothetical protein [Methylobacterium brachiatum]MDQ0541939.1 hypothetical protein [Methylobacterium brachiatum]